MLNSKASWELEWQLIFLLQFYMKGAPETCTPPSIYPSIYLSLPLLLHPFLSFSPRTLSGWRGLMGCWCGSCQWHCVCLLSPARSFSLSVLTAACWQTPAVISAPWEISATILSAEWQKLLMSQILPVTESHLVDSVWHSALNSCRPF